MESNSFLNDTESNSTISFLLPVGAAAFAPFLLLELVAAVVSNAILVALVILACAHKLNNKINIYLFSFAMGGLVGGINIACLLTVVIGRQWVLGEVICNICWFAILVYHTNLLAIYLVISREKLSGVKDPFKRQNTNRRAYVDTVVIWVLSIFFAVLLGGWLFEKTPNPDVENENFFVCFGLSGDQGRTRNSYFIINSISVIIYWIVSIIIIIITLSNFVRIMLELRQLKKLRLHYIQQSRTNKVVRINGRDKPLYCTGEERTAKSLTLVYLIQFSCILIGYGMLYIQAIRNFIMRVEIQDSPAIQIYFIVLLIILLFPCVNPVFLIMTNKRLRGRVKELYKCTLNPENEASPTHKLATTSTRVTFKINTSEKCQMKMRLFPGVHSKIAPLNP